MSITTRIVACAKHCFMIFVLVQLTACSTTQFQANTTQLQQQVFATEQAFANTMANRDFDAFQTFLANETIFFNGESAMRGKDLVTKAWQSYFRTDSAPFSWRPETVEVLDSGTLALSSGPVFDPDGNLVGRFNSIWRHEGEGQWKIIFDKGSDVCP